MITYCLTGVRKFSNALRSARFNECGRRGPVTTLITDTCDARVDYRHRILRSVSSNHRDWYRNIFSKLHFVSVSETDFILY